MLKIEEIPLERASEFWNIQYRYLINDGFLVTEEEKEYFQSSEYRDTLESYMLRIPDTLHMVYFVRDDIRIGASQFLTFKSEDGKCFILDFWVFPEFRGNGTGHKCFKLFEEYTKNDGALYYALNYAKDDSHRFWISNGFVDNGVDEYGSFLMIKKKD